MTIVIEFSFCLDIRRSIRRIPLFNVEGSVFIMRLHRFGLDITDIPKIILTVFGLQKRKSVKGILSCMYAVPKIQCK